MARGRRGAAGISVATEMRHFQRSANGGAPSSAADHSSHALPLLLGLIQILGLDQAKAQFQLL